MPKWTKGLTRSSTTLVRAAVLLPSTPLANARLQRQALACALAFFLHVGSSSHVFPLLPSPGPSVGMNNSSSLWVAARNGHAHVVQCLLSMGAAVNVPRGPDNSTPLWIACACGHVRVARDLLAGGADATVPSQQVHMIAVFGRTM